MWPTLDGVMCIKVCYEIPRSDGLTVGLNGLFQNELPYISGFSVAGGKVELVAVQRNAPENLPKACSRRLYRLATLRCDVWKRGNDSCKFEIVGIFIIYVALLKEQHFSGFSFG